MQRLEQLERLDEAERLEREQEEQDRLQRLEAERRKLEAAEQERMLKAIELGDLRGEMEELLKGSQEWEDRIVSSSIMSVKRHVMLPSSLLS